MAEIPSPCASRRLLPWAVSRRALKDVWVKETEYAVCPRELSLAGRWLWKQWAGALRDPLPRSDSDGVWIGTLTLQTALRAIAAGLAS